MFLSRDSNPMTENSVIMASGSLPGRNEKNLRNRQALEFIWLIPKSSVLFHFSL